MIPDGISCILALNFLFTLIFAKIQLSVQDYQVPEESFSP